MDKAGTRLMRILGTPTYFCAIGLAFLSPINHTLVAWLVAIAACFLYEFFYCKVLVACNQKYGLPYLAKWVVSVVIAQSIVIGVLFFSCLVIISSF